MTTLWERLPVPPQHVVPIVGGLLLRRRVQLPGVLRRTGLALTASGVAVNVWAVVARGGGDLEHPDGLVVAGPYRLSRNPMYLGWSMIHVGVGLWSRAPGVLASWPLLIPLVQREVCKEEQMLADQFGAAFEQYAARVPRYLALRLPAGSSR